MRKHFLICFCTLALAVSCVEPIVMDPMEEMPVVVQCVLERNESEKEGTTPTQYLDLYYARRPSEDSLRRIRDAKVEVSDGVNVYQFLCNGDRWECTFLPQFGTDYTLTVTLPNQTILTASTQFPNNCELLSQTLNDWGAPVSGLDFFSHTYEPSFYMLWQREMYSSKRTKIPYPHEAFIWIRSRQGDGPWAKLYTSHQGADNFNVSRETWDQLKCIPFMKQHVWQTGFSQQNWDHYASICSYLPIHEGFVRIHHPAGFIHRYYSSDAPRYWSSPEEEVYDDDVQIEWRRIAQSTFILGGEFNPDFQANGVPEYHVDFASKEYDKYLRYIVDDTLIHGDEFTSLYAADPIYTNVHNGIGIFGAVFHQTYNRFTYI